MNRPPESTWFQDEALLLDLARRHRPGVPAIPGYDELFELRRGGQGVVYAAVQRSTKRKVAIKVLLAGALATESQRRRFEREVEVAASLRHPHIIRVFDSGVTPEGYAYLVMEYVEGENLSEWLESRGRSLRPTIELFRKITDAVNAAHLRGVIHRDLKPSNVRIDATGEPRILDFGLAKLIGPAAGGVSESREFSQAGQFLGSLPWASPEQVEGDPNAIDVRSDVYALGVMLYQATTGRMPYDVSGTVSSLIENIRHAPPAPVSDQDIDEDLRTVIARCLAKEPTRRYQSAASLHSDLSAWLSGEPIAARRDSGWYTLRRTAARYRQATWAGAAALIVVSVLLAVAVRARGEAERGRAAAARAAARTEATVKLLTDLLGAASPNGSSGGREAKVVDVLARAAEQIDTSYAADPETQAQMHGVLGTTFTKLDMLEPARRHLTRAVELYSAAPEVGRDDLRVLQARGDLATLEVSSGNNEKGAELLAALDSDYARAGFERHTGVLNTRASLGVALRRMGKSEEALAVYDRAMAAIPTGEELGPDALSMRASRAVALEDLSRNEEAEREYRAVLGLIERTRGPDHADAIVVRLNLAHLLIHLGRPAEGREVLKTATAAAEKSCGPHHLTTLYSMGNLAKCEEDLGNTEVAIALYRDILTRYEARGTDKDNALVPASNLAGLLFNSGRQDEGIAIATSVLNTTLATKGESSLDACIRMNNLGVFLQKSGRLDEAGSYFERAVRNSAPEGEAKRVPHWNHLLFRVTYGNWMVAKDRHDEGEAMLLAAYEGLKAAFDAKNPYTRSAAKGLAKLYRKLDNAAEAQRWEAMASDAAATPAANPK